MDTVLLYLGFSLVTMGLIITLVGIGEKGFQTFELKLLGPFLVVCGSLLPVIKMLICPLILKKDENETAIN